MPQDDLDIGNYRFRGLHRGISLGTASDRYAGWIGQVYSENLYKDRLISRTHKVGGKSFKEILLPVDSVAEYFDHFRVLEIDYTFYRMPTARTIDAWRTATPSDFRFCLKASQQITHRERLKIPSDALDYLLSVLTGL